MFHTSFIAANLASSVGNARTSAEEAAALVLRADSLFPEGIALSVQQRKIWFEIADVAEHVFTELKQFAALGQVRRPLFFALA